MPRFHRTFVLGGNAMVSAVLICCNLLAASPTTATPGDLAAYEATQAGVGRLPEAQIKLALWCEAHGLQAERLKHLALAVLTDPANATARGLMGVAAFRGRWQPPDAIAERVKADAAMSAALAEYNARRARMANTAEAHWRLASWCEEKGLKAEATAHYTSVVRLDPSREAAWKRLGCKKHNGRWRTETQVAAERAEGEARKQADRHWRPLLARWRAWLGGKDREKAAEAEQGLAGLTDPRALPAVWAAFASSGPDLQGVGVRVLGQIDSPGASRALALLVIGGDSAEVRRRAAETLRWRDPRAFVGGLIGLFRDPVKYEVRPVGGPGSPGALFVKGKQFNVQRLYAPPPLPNIPLYEGEAVGYDEFGLPVVSRFLGTTSEVSVHRTGTATGIDPFRWVGGRIRNRSTAWTSVTETTTTPIDHTMTIPIGQIAAQYQMAALVAQEQLRSDVGQVESYNATARESNARVAQVLENVTGQDFGQDRGSWSSWWVDQLGYASSSVPEMPVPTVVENVPLAFLPQGVATPVTAQAGTPTTTITAASGVSLNHNCFRAGTPVRTLSGPRPIETIRVGDQVLTQDPKTGALGYGPVLAVFHNKPSPTLKIGVGAETVVATPIHRFWKAGQGWTMARDLKPGDSLRTLGGAAEVVAVDSDAVQPVFNVEVAGGGSFFVGDRGLLVHDNSLVLPVPEPFDAAPSLESIARTR